MTKKNYHNKNGRKTRSKPKKQFYQKITFWLFAIPLVLITFFFVNAFTGNKKTEDEQTVSNSKEHNEINNDNMANENVNEESEINSELTNNKPDTPNNDGNTEQNLLEGYNQLDIDYARIVLMHKNDALDVDSPTLHINDNLAIDHSTIASALGNFDFIRDLNITILRFEYYDGNAQEYTNIYYTPHGDGNITTYQLDDVDLFLDRKSDEMEPEVLDTAKTMYVDPSEPHIVAKFIDKVEFIYD